MSDGCKGDNMKVVVLIPALNPDDALVNTVRECISLGLRHIIVVDDGSAAEYQPVFDKVQEQGAMVLHHAHNRGKGAALKTGLEEITKHLPEMQGVVTADADGQHSPADILAVAKKMLEHPDSLVLGVRDFSGADVPSRSKFGNRLTASIFFLLTGTACSDTQTGLRGIPRSLFAVALRTNGERYDFEMNMLIDVARSRHTIVSVPIQTIYLEGNASSHFRVVRDSVLIYQQPLKYLAVALSSFVIDLGLFTVLSGKVFVGSAAGIWLSNIVARCLSGLYNFRMNQTWCFQAKERTMTQFVKYVALFVGVMLVSSAAVSTLRVLPCPPTLTKAVVDTILFFVNYQVQKRWIFAGQQEDKS